MRLGFRHTFLQAIGTVFVLCLVLRLFHIGPSLPTFAQTASSSGNPSGSATDSTTANAPAIPVPILMYHSILKDDAQQGKYVISPAVLEADLDALQQRGYETVTVQDLLAYVRDGTPLPAKPVMVTFDDGYFNNYVYAYPLLQARHMRAVVSIIGCQTALFSENGQENAYWSHLKLDHLKQMQDVFEVQNHSWNLHEYGERRGCLRRRGEDETTYEALLREDTEQTQRLLTEAGLPTPVCYTYPFGACSEESERVLQDMGFLCTLGCEEKPNLITRDPACLYELGRFNRAAGESTEQYLQRLLGE